jgi:acyl transferase family protein
MITKPFHLPARRGQTIRGLIHHPRVPALEPAVIVAVGGMGMPIRQTLRPAAHLLANGFIVIRFDPTNSVGPSDGNIADFTLTGLLDDLRLVASWAAGTFAVPGIGVFAVSLSARAALRAATADTGLLRIVGSVACVADVRATLNAVTDGGEHLRRWWAGELFDGESSGTVFGHLVRVRGLDCLISDNWIEARSAAVDLAAAPATRFVNVHGVRDPVVAAAGVLTTFAAARDSRVVLLPRAGHDFLPAQMRDALSVLVPEYRAALQSGGAGPDLPVHEPTIADLAACRQAERGAVRHLMNTARA